MIVSRDFKKQLSMMLMLAFIFPTGVFALNVKGTIDSDTLWTSADSPVQIFGDTVVAQGATLTIEPGVEVIFEPRADTTRGYNLVISGGLVARGNGRQVITFTAQDPAFPWGAIIFRDTSEDWDETQASGSVLSGCVVEYGGNEPDNFAMVVTQNAMPLISGNAIRFSSNAGIAGLANDAAFTFSGKIQITGNQIYNNPIGLLLEAEGGQVTGNYFLNNDQAISVSTRSSNLDISNNTVVGSSDELFGSGFLLELGQRAGGISEFQWVQTAGPAVELDFPNGARTTFAAPESAEGDVVTLAFDLTVTASDGTTDTDSVAVTVRGVNGPPVADAGADLNVQRSVPSVELNGTRSKADYGIAGYQWVQESGRNVTLKDADTPTPSFSLPSSVVSGDSMTFKLTVTDTKGLEDSDTMRVRFFTTNTYPSAVVAEETVGIPGQDVVLDGSASVDADGGIVAYAWQQRPDDPVLVTVQFADAARAYFEAPAIDSNQEVLTFDLTVTDTGGLTDTQAQTVRVVKAMPYADAGEDQTVFDSTTVLLDGSGSIDIGAVAAVDIAANEIQSTNGDAGQLAITSTAASSELLDIPYQLNTAGNNITFSDTLGDGYAVYLFNWPLTEDAVILDMPGNWWGSEDPEEIEALVFDQNNDARLPAVATDPIAAQALEDAGSQLNYPPLADAGPDLETAIDQKVTLDGSNSYDPDGIGKYNWEQIEGPAVTINQSNSVVASFIAPAAGTEDLLLRFRLTMSTGGNFTHTDEASVTVVPAEVPPPLVEAGGGCFIQSCGAHFGFDSNLGAIAILILMGGLLAAVLGCCRRFASGSLWLLVAAFLIPASADAGYFAVGGGGGGQAEQYNITVEAGAKGIVAGRQELMFAFGIPFIPHGDENIPENTIASPCPNDECQPIGDVALGTEVGFYGKLGIKLWSSNFYANLIGGLTFVSEAQLVQSAGTGLVYQNDTDTTLEPLYGLGFSYFAEDWRWPILLQLDFDVTRGATGTIGWHW